MRRSAYFGVAFTGLLVVAAISVAAGSGRKPAMLSTAGSARMLTDAEVAQVGQRFPELRVRLGGISQVRNELLEHLFPSTSFYKTFNRGGRPPFPYLIAISGDKLLSQPSGFNWLLAEHDMEVTDKNIIELAKAFVVLAVGDEPITNPTTGDPDGLDSLLQITFLDGKRIEERIGGTSYETRLEVKVGEQIEDWYFAVLQSQFSFVARRGPKGLIKNYLPTVVESHPSRGQLDPTPDSVVEVPRMAAVQAERDSLGTGSASVAGTEEGQEVKVSLRRLPASEVMDILQKFPEMVPSYMAAKKDDAAYLTSAFDFSEVKAARLEQVFPTARFYKGLDFSSQPPFPYLMAVVGNKRYWMPGHFNQLLLDNGLQVTYKNIIELAKTFVLLDAGNEPVYGNADIGGPSGDELASFPQVTFVEARRIEEYSAQSTFTWDVEIRCRIDGEVQTWKFSQSRRFPRNSRPVRVGQFARALLLVDGKPGRLYRLVQALEETRTGRLDTDPRIEIDTADGNATAEFDSLYYHYYLESFRDGVPTNYWVRLRLYEFDSCEAHVYVRIKPQEPYTFGPDTLMGPVAIDGNGEGFIDWAPNAGTQTGMTDVCAGSMPPGDTFSRLTPIPEQLSIEQVFTGQFQGGGGSLAVHFCDQFFAYHDSLEGHAPVFAQRVKNAMLESWQTQVNTWSLGTPPDSDNVHQVFINDAINWYHCGSPRLRPTAAAYAGPNRRISVPFNIWGGLVANYTNEDSVIRSAIAHEFYHGIQWGLSSGKWKLSRWRWFTDGQARFIQSVQCPVEEFKDSLGLRLYATSADSLLTTYMNTSLETLSIRHSGYPYCLFWRHLFERFDSTGVADGVRMVRDCYAANVGTSNSIGRGKAAIDSAIRTYVPGGIPPAGWGNFGQILDQFAVACYLNDDTSFHCWNPNPPGVYSRPDFTLGTDTAFRLGPDETDAIGFTDSIPHSFGIDLMEVALDGRVPVPESEIGVHHKGTKTQRGYEAQMVLSAWRSWRLGGSISDPGPADGLDKQSAGSRLAALAGRV